MADTDKAQTEGLKALPVQDVIARVGLEKAVSYKCVGALIFTYRCSISCDHCLFGCGPRVNSPPMSVEDGLIFLRQLHELDRVIHIAGGEAMLYWNELAQLLEKAGREGIAPHFVETNSSWAVNESIVRERFHYLRDCGVLGVYFSADPYHFRHVAPENFLRAQEVACKVFGDQYICGHKATPEKTQEFVRIGRDPALLSTYVRQSPPMIVGNAAVRLAQYLPDIPVEKLDLGPGKKSSFDSGCYRGVLPPTVWEIHIDPYGNIQTNCGIILGNAKHTSVKEVLQRGVTPDNPIVFAVAQGGPCALLELARAKGCPVITQAKSKCHLCYLVRGLLRPHFPQIFGPDEVYSTVADALANALRQNVTTKECACP